MRVLPPAQKKSARHTEPSVPTDGVPGVVVELWHSNGFTFSHKQGPEQPVWSMPDLMTPEAGARPATRAQVGKKV